MLGAVWRSGSCIGGFARGCPSCYYTGDFFRAFRARFMTKTLLRLSLFPILLACAWLALARDIADLDLSVHRSDIAPAVTLREHENRMVEEYRVNNNLYMIKVTPSIGAPYFLVDEDGSGDMAWNRGGSQFEQNVPQWALISW